MAVMKTRRSLLTSTLSYTIPTCPNIAHRRSGAFTKLPPTGSGHNPSTRYEGGSSAEVAGTTW